MGELRDKVRDRKVLRLVRRYLKAGVVMADGLRRWPLPSLDCRRVCAFWISAADGDLAKHAAEHYGCCVMGITISEKQRSRATESCRGLPVEILLQDYRDLTEQFDRIASVGMLEHVGAKNYRHYMRTVFRSLHDGGVFLCQSIAGNWQSAYTDPWITRYIFPNSMLPSAA